MICDIQGCGGKRDSRGLCSMHYLRLRKHGDPLGGPPFRARKGQISAFLHKAISYEGTDCLIWPFSRNSRGYAHLRRGGRDQLATRIVCERVNGPSPTDKPEAAHTCGNGNLGCVSGRHLVWKDRAGNAADMIAHGTAQCGEKMWIAKLTEENVREIRGSSEATKVIATRFGVTPSNIIFIRRRMTWKHIA